MSYLEGDYRVNIYLSNHLIFDKSNYLSDVGNTVSTLSTENKSEKSHGSVVLLEKDFYFRKLIYNEIIKNAKVKIEQYCNNEFINIYSGIIRDYTYNKHKLNLNIGI